MKRVKHLVEFCLVLAAMFTVNLLPRVIACAFGRFVGRVGYRLWGYRRRVAKANLRFCFPEKDERWVNATAKRSFEVFGQSIVEQMRFVPYGRRNIRSWVRVENVKALEEAGAGGRGALLITGHYGSYELGGAAVGTYGRRTSVVVQPQSNRYVDGLMNRVRRRAGLGVIRTGTPGIKAVVKELRANGIVAMVSDQDAGADGVLVEFFGRPASAARGPAAFALKTGAAMCCCYVVHDGGPKHTLFIEDAVSAEPKAENYEDDVKYWTQVHMSRLEKWCRRRPEMYLWMHRRFKTTAPEIYDDLYD